MIQFLKIVLRRTVYSTKFCKIQITRINVISLSLLSATKRLKLTLNKMLSGGYRLCAIKREGACYVNHVEPVVGLLLMPHQDCELNITIQGVHLIQITIAGCRLWASTRGGGTFSVGVNVMSVIQAARKIDP